MQLALLALYKAWIFGLLLCSCTSPGSALSPTEQLKDYRAKLEIESQAAFGILSRIENGISLTTADTQWLSLLGDKILQAKELANPDAGCLFAKENRHVEFPWFADSASDGYPLPILLICIVIGFTAMFIWETMFLGTTLMRSAKRLVDRAVKQVRTSTMGFVQRRSNTLEKTLSNLGTESCQLFQGFGGCSSFGHVAPESPAAQKQISQKKEEEHQTSKNDSWSPDDCGVFWKGMDEWANVEGNINGHKLRRSHAELGEVVDVIGFSQCSYHAYETDGKVTIGVQRIGKINGTVKVKVETVDKPERPCESATVGKNFKHMDQEITFEPNEHFKTIEVVILANDTFDPARWFLVRIVDIISGNAVLAKSPADCRVYISDDYHFPANIPKEKRNSGFWRVAYFVKECKDVRGSKFWKTMCAMLYYPWHKVVVTSLVQKFLIDWATQPDSHPDDTAWTAIVALVGLQFASTAILRWADVVQTKNRGRTGGIRQLYRLHLLEKMLMLAHEDQWNYSASQWFYGAIHDVDGVTLDIYWEVFKTAQHLTGLFLSVVTLVILSIYGNISSGRSYDVSQLLPTLAFILMLPVTLIWILKRTPTLAMHVLNRKRGESAWMEVFSWLSHARCILYGFGPIELVDIEVQFKNENRKFMGPHQAARDYMNDSRWVTQWLTSMLYCLILLWGGFALYAERQGDKHQVSKMTTGEYVLLMKLFLSIGKYVKELNDSLVCFLRGEVSLGQIERLMNGVKRDRFGADRKNEIKALERARTREEEGIMRGDTIELEGIEFHPDKSNGVGPLGSISLTAPVAFPLGSVVRVAGSDEGARLAFLATIAGVITPKTGVVTVPCTAERVLVPPLPVTPAGRLSVREVFQLAGAKPDDAVHLANIFGLCPNHSSEHLPPGSLQILMIVRALLRDPEVLVLSRPMAYLAHEVRIRIASLLRLWQSSGGVEAMLKRLRKTHEGVLERLASNEVEVDAGIEKPKLDVGDDVKKRWKHLPVRTLVICEDDLPPSMCSSEDILINLDLVTADPGYLCNPLLKETQADLGKLGFPSGSFEFDSTSSEQIYVTAI